MDGWFRTFWEATNRKQQQVLLGFESDASRGDIALGQKKTYPVAQRGQGAVIGGRNLYRHGIIIS